MALLIVPTNHSPSLILLIITLLNQRASYTASWFTIFQKLLCNLWDEALNTVQDDLARSNVWISLSCHPHSWRCTLHLLPLIYLPLSLCSEGSVLPFIFGKQTPTHPSRHLSLVHICILPPRALLFPPQHSNANLILSVLIKILVTTSISYPGAWLCGHNDYRDCMGSHICPYTSSDKGQSLSHYKPRR